jgi:hypothetical protein
MSKNEEITWRRFFKESYVRILLAFTLACFGLIMTGLALYAVGFGVFDFTVSFTVEVPITAMLVFLGLFFYAVFWCVMMFKNGLWAIHAREMLDGVPERDDVE